jgi:predicted permease
MKKIINFSPYLVVLIAQFVIGSYTIILLATILIGFIAAFYIERKKVFLKSFLIAFLVFATVFLMYQFRVDYIKSLLENLGLPGAFIFVFFPLLNALNTAILFYFGYFIGCLVDKKQALLKE